MERKDLEDLIRGSIKPAKQRDHQQGDPAIDALAKGCPEIIANRPLTLSGSRPEIDNTQWLAGEVVHIIVDACYVTEVT
ncbi:hypothetical protein [Telmatospirillum sp. J64-1]|uniref:hypothetical protein n=1 Tax=Telmatospirillum sp. J64-1 TaxID=2502183 RepID=UPI00115C91C6|nr:hypothetical protein [Telmatospirillum sp. J64-1]